jgi:hypothetical protein
MEKSMLAAAAAARPLSEFSRVKFVIRFSFTLQRTDDSADRSFAGECWARAERNSASTRKYLDVRSDSAAHFDRTAGLASEHRRTGGDLAQL